VGRLELKVTEARFELGALKRCVGCPDQSPAGETKRSGNKSFFSFRWVCCSLGGIYASGSRSAGSAAFMAPGCLPSACLLVVIPRRLNPSVRLSNNAHLTGAERRGKRRANKSGL